MCNLFGIIVIHLFLYLIVELFTNLLFFNLLKRVYSSKQQDHEKAAPWLKGVLERICLNAGLLLGYPQILIVFGASKIGTKINNETINSEY